LDLTVSALHVYPIKSCRGFRLDAARVERGGFALDRRWMIVDAAGKFVTQRTDARLALIDVEARSDALLVRAPQMPDLEVPFVTEGAERLVKVWDDKPGAAIVSERASKWFSEYLGGPHDLVHICEEGLRRVDPKRARPGDQVGFADAYPFLLASTSSLEDLVSRAGVALEMLRFRPNIVVSGAPPWAEDDWRTLTIGELGFRALKPCSRCVITTIDPRTAAKGPEPLRTLATFRQKRQKVYFGINLAHDGLGTLRVGDRVLLG
jgi:hypothetical protein